MNFLSNLFGGVASFASGRIWQLAAMGMLAAWLASSAYLGYQWHSAASDRDTAQKSLVAANAALATANEKIGKLKAEKDNLEGAIKDQNNAIGELQRANNAGAERYKLALVEIDRYKAKIGKLKTELEAQPKSQTLEEAVRRQREAIDSVNKLRVEGATP